jgi:hypothetical protein
MKATVEFDDQLYKELKLTAIHRGRTIKDLLNEGIRLILNSKEPLPASTPKKPFPLISSSRKKTLPIPDDASSRMEAEEF